MKRLIGVGDNTLDTYTHILTQFPGGNALNVAVMAGRCGVDSAYIGAVGEDPGGDWILESLKKEGVDISHCKILKGIKNSYVEVRIKDGERFFESSFRGASSLLELSQEDFRYIQNFDIVHTSIYSGLEKQIGELREASKKLSFDFSDHIADKSYILNVLPYIDIPIFSVAEMDFDQIQGFTEELTKFQPKLIVFTQGKKGSWVYSEKEFYHQPIVKIDTVDTLGAGDAFIANFLVNWLNGKSVPESMQQASEFAAKNCEFQGAFGYGRKY